MASASGATGTRSGGAVQQHLTDCITRGQVGVGDVHSIERLQATGDALADQTLTLLREAKLGDGTIRIDLDPGALAETLNVQGSSISPEMLSIQLPYMQRRRGVETRLIIGATQPDRDDILIANVARASVWRAAL